MVDREKALEKHSEVPGKIKVDPSVSLETREDLDLVYTPGVAEPVREIDEDRENVYSYTSKGNLVAIVSDGSAVLGLGDVGPEAAMPVMEGKANLMKKYGEVDGFPVVLDADSPGEIVESVERMSPGFGAVNLEDIAAPECFRIEETLKKRLDIPVFHDDQHGTAVVVLAALENALELVGKDIENARIVVSGMGAAGYAVTEFLLSAGAENIVPLDSSGILQENAEEEYKRQLVGETLAGQIEGGLEEAMEDADVFIGLSVGGTVSENMVESMAEESVVFALANPDPEIEPEKARNAGAEIVATGRSDHSNQVNNSLAFPGIFRGALDARASEINHEMKEAAAHAIADFVDPARDRIVPHTMDRELSRQVAKRVKSAARETGVARR